MIDVIDLKKSFGTLNVLKGVNLTVEEGEKIAIIGPSGSGKSTFLRCLNCLEDPTGGSIIFEGEDLADLKVVRCDQNKAGTANMYVCYEDTKTGQGIITFKGTTGYKEWYDNCDGLTKEETDGVVETPML